MEALFAVAETVRRYAGLPRTKDNLHHLLSEVNYELQGLYFDFTNVAAGLEGVLPRDVEAAYDHVMTGGNRPITIREGIERLYAFVHRETIRRIVFGWTHNSPTDDIVISLLGSPDKRHSNGLYGRALVYYTTNLNTLRASARHRAWERERGHAVRSPHPKHFNDPTLPPAGDTP